MSLHDMVPGCVLGRSEPGVYPEVGGRLCALTVDLDMDVLRHDYGEPSL